jgi:hypothetical protein
MLKWEPKKRIKKVLHGTLIFNLETNAVRLRDKHASEKTKKQKTKHNCADRPVAHPSIYTKLKCNGEIILSGHLDWVFTVKPRCAPLADLECEG